MTKSKVECKEKVRITTPFTWEDITSTTPESFTKKIIPYAKEWIENKLWQERIDMKQTIKDSYTEEPQGIN